MIASAAYSTAAFGRFGPAERDTRGMATSLGIAEPWMGDDPARPRCSIRGATLHPESAVGRALRSGSSCDEGARALALPRGASAQLKAGGYPAVGASGAPRGPSAKVIVPSTTTLPFTRATPAQQAHPAPEPFDDRFDHHDVTRVHGLAVAHPLDAHEEDQLLAVLGLRRGS